ncbi:hypothetical protein ES705_18701 [subsurface metagenome]
MAVKRDKRCPACGSTDWWWRQASGLGGPGEWLCNRCHPQPASLEVGHSELPVYPVSIGKLKVSATPVTVTLDTLSA